jgi:hypothetical protein
MNRSELIALVMESRARLNAALAQVADIKTTETSLYNIWSVKDLLAHLGWWEQRATDIMTTLCAGGVPADAVEFGDVNAVNAHTYARNRDQPLVDVRESEKATYTALLRLVETTPEADLFDDQRFAWTGGRPLFTWVTWNTYEHYDEHLVALTAWIAMDRA